jgi:predicted MFS family arabinose efflux permease
MMSNSKPEKLWGKDYIIVMIASAGISFCNYFFFSTLPIYAQKISGTVVYINTLMFNRCSSNRRGTVSAAYFSSIDIGYSIGSIWFGFIAARFNYYYMYFGSTIFTTIALIVYLSDVVKRSRQKNTPIHYVSEYNAPRSRTQK